MGEDEGAPHHLPDWNQIVRSTFSATSRSGALFLVVSCLELFPTARKLKWLVEEEPLAIEAKPVEYSDLLRETMALEMDDSLEELRRMIKRTRNKMDTEMKVLDGFISDVNQIKGMQRSFEEPLAALPPNRSGSQPALKAPPHSMALQAISSAVALSESRRLPKRSTPLPALTHSQSTPAIGSAAMLALRSAQPLVLPKRRAPPFSQGRLRSELR
eukprot:g17108.t1